MTKELRVVEQRALLHEITFPGSHSWIQDNKIQPSGSQVQGEMTGNKTETKGTLRKKKGKFPSCANM